MRYGPWPRRGRLLRHFWFSSSFPRLFNPGGSRPCQGGTHCVQWGGRWRPALTCGPAGITLRFLRRKKNAAATSSAASALPGAVHSGFSPASGRARRGGSTRPPPVPGSTQPGSIRPFVQPRSAATCEGWGGTLPLRCTQPTPVPRPARVCAACPPARTGPATAVRQPESNGGPGLDVGALGQYIPNACTKGGTTAEDPWQERHSR